MLVNLRNGPGTFSFDTMMAECIKDSALNNSILAGNKWANCPCNLPAGFLIS